MCYCCSSNFNQKIIIVDIGFAVTIPTVTIIVDIGAAAPILNKKIVIITIDVGAAPFSTKKMLLLLSLILVMLHPFQLKKNVAITDTGAIVSVPNQKIIIISDTAAAAPIPSIACNFLKQKKTIYSKQD